MVKGIIKGFAFTIGKIIAFLFISLVIGTLLFKIDDVNITKLPFKQLIMNLFFVNAHALDRTYVLYVCNFNNSTCSRYLTLNDGQIDRGTIINHESGSAPNAQTFFLGQTNWQSTKRYIINIDYTIESNGSPLTYSSKFNHINTMFDTSSRIGTTEYTLLSSSSNNGIYRYHYSIRSDITFPRTVSSVALHANFSTNTLIRYIKVNSWSVTEVTNNNTDIINNNNQNTTNIINNNNQNTENIINNQNENTQEIIDTITDDNLPDVINSGGGGGTYFDTISQSSNTPISDILLLPINLINSFVNNLSSSCSSINLGTLYNHQLTLPCINLETYLGSNLWGLIDVCSCFFMIYNIFMACISFFEKWTSLNDTFDELYYVKERK